MENPMSVAYVADVLGKRPRKERHKLSGVLIHRMVISGRTKKDANRIIKEAFKQMYIWQKEENRVRVAQSV